MLQGISGLELLLDDGWDGMGDRDPVDVRLGGARKGEGI